MGVDHGDNRQEVGRLQRQVAALSKSGQGQTNHAGSGDRSIQLGPDADASGDSSVALGDFSIAAAANTVAVGSGAEADAQGDVAVGAGSTANTTGGFGVAIGFASKVQGAGGGVALGHSAFAQDGGVAVGSANASGTNSAAIGNDAHAAHAQGTAVGYNAVTSATNQVMLGRVIDTVVVPGTFSNPSARRLKQNIIPAPDLRDIFPDLVEYEYIDAAGRKRLGYIADDLVGTDAERFVQFDDDGRPLGIDYLTLLLVEVAQLNARVAALENKET